MPRALNLLRQAPHYRRDAFDAGLRAAGFDVVNDLRDPGPGDLVLTWNAYGGFGDTGALFERRGATWLVAENAPLGNEWRGQRWYSLAVGAVALTGGEFRPGGAERWDAWGVEVAPWRTEGETVILAQRGIGAPGARSPDHWAEAVRARIGGRIREHPGTAPALPLADDLARAGEVITWSSAAAVQALLLGVSVWHAHPRFVCAGAARQLAEHGKAPPLRDDAARLQAFRRLAWAMWNLDEITSGAPIARLCDRRAR